MRTEDMRNMIVAAGGSVDDLPDNLPSTLQKRLIETMGGNCPDGNLPSDLREAFAGCGGASSEKPKYHIAFSEDSTTFDVGGESWLSKVEELVIPEGVTSFINTTRTEKDDEGYDVDVQRFNDYYFLRKITFPSTMTTIPGVFERHQSLEEIIISEGTTVIDNYAFDGCYMVKKVTLPETLTSIGMAAFRTAYIPQIKLPSKLTTIRDYAFQNCKFTEIEIPASVTTIGLGAFDSKALTKITIHKLEGSITGAPWGATNAEVIWTG